MSQASGLISPAVASSTSGRGPFRGRASSHASAAITSAANRTS